MATKAEDVKANIKRLGGTLAAHKGWFTHDHRTLSRQLDELLVPGRPSSEETLALAKARYEKLRVHADNVDAVIGRMCELTPEDSDHHMSCNMFSTLIKIILFLMVPTVTVPKILMPNVRMGNVLVAICCHW
jgi:hypothetical protein